MKKFGILAAALLLGAPAAFAQCTPQPVEDSASPGESGPLAKWDRYVETFTWSASVLQARQAAARNRKLVLYFMISGNLDEESC